MEQDLAQIVKADPNYQKLVRTRSRYGWTLTWAMMAVYDGNGEFDELTAANRALAQA